MSSPLVPTRFPRVPLWRRGAAFGFDFGIAWFLSFAGGTLAVPLFLLVWFGLRVALPIRNHGQSPGRWAFNLSLIYEPLPLAIVLLGYKLETANTISYLFTRRIISARTLCDGRR